MMDAWNQPKTSREQRLMHYIQKRCFIYSEQHRQAAEIYAKRATWLTVVNLFSSIMILFIAANDDAQLFINRVFLRLSHLTSIGVEFANQADIADLFVGFFGAMAVSSAAIQYLLKYEERNMIHKYVSADYENFVRKTARFLARDKITDEELHRLNKQINYLTRHAPPISKTVSRVASGLSAKWADFEAEVSGKKSAAYPGKANTAEDPVTP